MILYPTETIYALGVHAFVEAEIAKLFQLKGREGGKPVSLLVRDIEDIARYAELGDRARQIAARFLPGPLTLVLPAKAEAARLPVVAPDGTLSFRISSDPLAQQLIAEFMATHGAPLTCTSANVSGQPSPASVPDILKQFQVHDRDLSVVDRIVDDGPRIGTPSTVVRVVNNEVIVHRVGSISHSAILGTFKTISHD